MREIYSYMRTVLSHAASLLRYPTSTAITTHRMIPSPKGAWPFNASNWTRVPSDPHAFMRTLRNDSTTYPITAQISEADWAAVVLHYNYSRMGTDFTSSAKALKEEVRLILLAREQEEAARKANETAARKAAADKDQQQRLRGGRRGGKRRGGGGRGRGRGPGWRGVHEYRA